MKPPPEPRRALLALPEGGGQRAASLTINFAETNILTNAAFAEENIGRILLPLKALRDGSGSY